MGYQPGRKMDVKGLLIIIGCSLLALTVLGAIGAAIYREATDPCRCIERKCWTVMGMTTDEKGYGHTTSSVDCRCLKKWCPAEACK